MFCNVQGPVEYFIPLTGTCWTCCAFTGTCWTYRVIYRYLLNMSLPCSGTYWPCPSMSKDLLNMLCHVQGPVERVMLCSGTYWPCPSMSKGLLNMSCHVQGPIERILPQLQQDVRQFPCRGLLAFLHSDRGHAEPQRHDSQVHMSLKKLENCAVGYLNIYIFWGCYSVFVTPLIMPPILHFWEMSGFKLRDSESRCSNLNLN